MYFLAWFLLIGLTVYTIWFFARRTPPTAPGILLGTACFVAAYALALWVVLVNPG